MKRILLLINWIVVSVIASGGCVGMVSKSENNSQKLQDIFERYWSWSMHSYPEQATYNGYPGLNDKWTDFSEPAVQKRKEDMKGFLTDLRTIDRSKLSQEDQLNYDLLKESIQTDVEEQKYFGEYLMVDQMNGAQIWAPQMFIAMPKETVKDYEDMIARLNGIGTLVDQTIAMLEKGLTIGVTPPKVTLRSVSSQIDKLLSPDIDQNPNTIAFTEFSEKFSPEQKESLRARADLALNEVAIPAYKRLQSYLSKTYVPNSRETTAFTSVKDGKSWYAFLARKHTTTTLTPEQIHEIGLKEVKRIRDAMTELANQAGYSSVKDFAQFVERDKQFFFSSEQELVSKYREIGQQLDKAIPRIFGRIPKLGYRIEPLPEFQQAGAPQAYYYPGTPAHDGVPARKGIFYVNPKPLDQRPSWEMEALILHEAVPGHHMQIAIAQEMQDVPEFRKYSLANTAFVEGWGLYSESLGSELGFYKSPYSLWGRYVFEIWRAIRLVVDTGMHALGWTRQQAIDYFKENSGKEDHEIVTEVDRYLVFPGQALAYKIGELKIKELRRAAEQQLNSKFDIKEFHEEVLKNGSLPLDILERQINKWIEDKLSCDKMAEPS
ncbi:MAG: DUF885 family protein [Bacteriovoracia bacterium]